MSDDPQFGKGDKVGPQACPTRVKNRHYSL
jgi:hypothetical protein